MPGPGLAARGKQRHRETCLLGANAARHAKGGTPDPARNPYSDEAIEARYHTTVIALMELERRRMVPGAAPEELSLEGLT